MNKRLSIPGTRSLDASLDTTDSEMAIVACPPHPQFDGDRHDSRLEAVSDSLLGAGVDCLRFDYGPWDEGNAEQTDVHRAVAWARDRYDRVGLFGFSFGASMAILAASSAAEGSTPDVLSALAPAAQVTNEKDVCTSLDTLAVPTQVVYGERDDTATWKPVVDRARDNGVAVRSFPADHFFVGQQAKVAGVVSEFLVNHLRAESP
ncbi:alpha/beta hydrolase [Halovenus rubra]|uniref:Alpha/beta hydrolase n=2 Tax=Halovenus rubra TaxID=869890 RepID=A0ACC7DZ83_9EURY|nr:alpha/beta hydrolase [Halovenus rubra]